MMFMGVFQKKTDYGLLGVPYGTPSLQGFSNNFEDSQNVTGSPQKKSGSIIFRQKQSRCRPIRLGNDPNAFSLPCLISRQQPIAIDQGVFVRLSIMLIDFSPIASNVPVEELSGTLTTSGQCVERTGRGDDLAERERFVDGDHGLASFLCSSTNVSSFDEQQRPSWTLDT
jgi:hypothetical protein